MKKYFHAAGRKPANLKMGLLGLFLSTAIGITAASAFSEPYTVFYGKVLGTASAQDFLITEGELEWTIQRSDGHLVQLKTTLYAYHENQFSYRLDVPHSAFALGVGDGLGGVPMPPTPRSHIHASVTLDGEDVVLLGPAGSTFTTEQLLRTATYRLDLGADREALDSDGDGIPDWWEDLYGLDKQDPNDANLDLSGDGITALEAYLRGLDPNRDYRAPALLTEEIVVYPAGSTAIVLDTADVDSTPEQIQYTLTDVPPSGTLTLRNAHSDPSEPDEGLTVGGTFSHADVLRGRLIYDHDGSHADLGSFSVEVRDEDPARDPDQGTVWLLGFEPALHIAEDISPLEAQRLENHAYAHIGYVVLDASGLPADTAVANPSAGLDLADLSSYLAQYGYDRPYLFVGGQGASSTVAGGHRDDVIIAGKEGGTLSGGMGWDRFVFRHFTGSRYAITDFLADGPDQIDLTSIPASSGGRVSDYIHMVSVADGHELRVLSGIGGTTNLVIELPGLAIADADLYDLIESDQLLVGDLQLEPIVTVVADTPRASQSGPTPGIFRLDRRGSLSEAIHVNLGISGSAQNGVDYVQLPSVLTIPAGVASKEIEIMPYQTGYQGPTKVAQVTVQPGSGYTAGPLQTAQVVIENLTMVVRLDVLEDTANLDSGTPAVIRVRREHVTASDAIVLLQIGGSAKAGTDYDTIPTFVYFAPGIQNALINVVPRSAAQLSAGTKTVEVSLVEDDDYIINPDRASASVYLIERADSFAAWQERVFGEPSEALHAFAEDDAGGYGVTHFQRYAFGLDPHAPSRQGLPEPFMYQGRLTIAVRQPMHLTDVDYRVRASTDLMDWEGHEVAVVPIAAPAGRAATDWGYYQVQTEDQDVTVFSVIEAEWQP